MTSARTDRLQTIVAAAALRSEAVLWAALERALADGLSPAEVDQAIETAAQAAAGAVRADAHRVLREVLARQGARDRWGIPEG